MMTLYHSTDPVAATAILADGFRDGEGSYMLTGLTLRGVFLSDTPLDENEGCKGTTLLRVTIPEGVDLDEFEVVEDRGYREWCVPADLINRHGSVRRLDASAAEDARASRWHHA